MIQYQTKIETEKLFPKTVSFEMEMEDKTIAIQVVDCWMRLTGIRWQVKPWNRYQSFTAFAEKKVTGMWYKRYIQVDLENSKNDVLEDSIWQIYG